MEPYDIDAYSPAQMAARVEKAGITKGNLNFLSMLVLAVLAGIFIAFGAVLYTFVVHDSTLSVGLTKIVGGLVFCLGLILVIVAGAELFTGNNLLVMAYVSRKISLEQLLRNWVIVFVGNLIGSLVIVFLIWASGQWTASGAAVGAKVLMIANSKVSLTFWQALVRGILCNMLVCLAVWLCFSGRSVIDKISAIVFPVTAFVALGFEHSVANMYFVPAGLLARQDSQIVAAAQAALGGTLDLSRLTVLGFLLHNLLPVTLGNIVGGSFFVAAVYWFVYLRRSAAEPLRRMMTSGPPMVAPDISVAEAVQIMKERSSSSILVGQDGKAVGIASEADIVRRVVAKDLSPEALRIEEIMSSPLIGVDIKTSLYEVYRTMADRHIRHLIIRDGEKQVGFVSVKDLLKKPVF